MMNTKQILYFLLLYPFIGFAQDTSQFVIASQGDYNKSQNISLEWTLGQSFIESTVSDTPIFTQGFIQSLAIKNLIINQSKDWKLIITPNPVRSSLHIYFDNSEELLLNISIYDINGRLIKQVTELSTNRQISLNLTSFSIGMYMLKISNLQGDISETHKIIKL